jgi:biofilm PGA synthesis N-glycosyltransferase PgaC
MNWENVIDFIGALIVSYPFVMAWYWMTGALLFHFLRTVHEPLPDQPPKLPIYPRSPSSSPATMRKTR